MAVLLTPGAASGHAAFVSAEPAPGAELGSAPGAVVLTFTEPINRELSGAEVSVSTTGERFEGGPTGEGEITVPVGTNAPGVYEVTWTTVSTVDGHTLHGTFRFGVGVPPGEGAEGSTGATPGRADLLIALLRAVEYGALLLAVGMLVLRFLALRRPAVSGVRIRLTPVLLVAAVSGLAVVAGEASAAGKGPSPATLTAFLSGGSAGTARVVRIAAELVAIPLARARASLAAIPLTTALVALAGAGHAAAVRPVWWSVGIDAAHLITAGMWVGAILALVFVRVPGGLRGDQGRVLLQRFSPLALVAFSATVLFGVLRGAQELNGIRDLVATPYGVVLSAKVLGVAAMVPLSLRAWRRRSPTPRAEAGIALFVIAAAALLAAFPLPPGRLTEAAEARASAPLDRGLPRAGDLTLAGEAGETLVALTLRPGEPGENQTFLYVLPLGGEEKARNLDVRLRVDGERHPLDRCGATCLTATLSIAGGERTVVKVGGEAGGTASLVLPDFPTEDGNALLLRMQDRMHDLSTYRLEEVLRPVNPPLEASYEFRAPDRMHMRLSTGAETILIGDTRFNRDAGQARWERKAALPLRVPQFVWDSGPDFVAARVVDRAAVGGVGTDVVSFAISGGTPIWFRLWIDAEGLVRRAEMRARGHFMDHRYFDFDAPLRIQPPPAAEVGGS